MEKSFSFDPYKIIYAEDKVVFNFAKNRLKVFGLEEMLLKEVFIIF